MSWRGGIDEAYATFADNITAFADLLGAYEDPSRSQRLRATRIEIETPVEIGLRASGGDVDALGTAPPIYRTETTIMPVFHTMRLTIVPIAQLTVEPADDDTEEVPS
ncbi:MAG: hypothetical protein ACR2P3_02695 [Geminicoccaceae bacterium]